MAEKFNKKGQDLSIGTLILIVLGIIVLVLLILGFSIGWGNLWEKINIFGGSSSVGDVVTACNLAVTSNNPYDYCQNFRKVKVNGETIYINCEYVETQLQNKINCDSQTKPDAFQGSWADWYCKQLQDAKKISKETKINSVTCLTTPPPAQ